jgi:hypothetical protein
VDLQQLAYLGKLQPEALSRFDEAQAISQVFLELPIARSGTGGLRKERVFFV